ncbi:hypothetical protein Trydic_g6843 [Trypoxylus dichotomus]
MQRLAVTGSHVHRPRTGRKRITTDPNGRKILLGSLKNRRKTSSDLGAELSGGFNKTICAIRKWLQEAGIKVCKARKKPWFFDKNDKGTVSLT